MIQSQILGICVLEIVLVCMHYYHGMCTMILPTNIELADDVAGETNAAGGRLAELVGGAGAGAELLAGALSLSLLLSLSQCLCLSLIHI